MGRLFPAPSQFPTPSRFPSLPRRRGVRAKPFRGRRAGTSGGWHRPLYESKTFWNVELSPPLSLPLSNSLKYFFPPCPSFLLTLRNEFQMRGLSLLLLLPCLLPGWLMSVCDGAQSQTQGVVLPSVPQSCARSLTVKPHVTFPLAPFQCVCFCPPR